MSDIYARMMLAGGMRAASGAIVFAPPPSKESQDLRAKIVALERRISALERRLEGETWQTK